LDENGNILVKGITTRLLEIGHTKCAITDHAMLSAIAPAFDSFNKAKTSSGNPLQLIPGCEFYFVDDISIKEGPMAHLVVLAKNKTGWENIMKMNYIAYEKGSKSIYDRRVGRIDMNILKQHTEGLVISAACLAGIPQRLMLSNQRDQAIEHVKLMKKLFPENYYLEVQPVDFYTHLEDKNTLDVDKEWILRQAVDQKRSNDLVVELGELTDTKIVCTTDSHYVSPEDRETHLLLLAIQSKKTIFSQAIGPGVKDGRLAFEATPMLDTQQLIEVFTETESGFNGYSRDQVEQWVKNTITATDCCEYPSYLKSDTHKIPLYPVQQADDFQQFLKWKNSLDQNQIEGILNCDHQILEERLKGLI
jgi:DNA polymerase III alpha subunit